MYRKLCSPCISIELYSTAKQNRKMSFFLGQTILSFSLLEDKQNFKFGGV